MSENGKAIDTRRQTIGETVKAYRLQKQLSQNELARLAMTTATSISRIENGVQGPGRVLAPALSRVLGIDLRFLLGE